MKRKRRKYLMVVAVFVFMLLAVLPAQAAGKKKVITLRAGQTCYISTVDGRGDLGKAEKMTVSGLTENSCYDYIRSHYSIKMHRGIKGKKIVAYKRFSGVEKRAVTCTNGQIKIRISGIKGKLACRVSVKSPYKVKVLNAGESMTAVAPTYLFGTPGTRLKFSHTYGIGKRKETLDEFWSFGPNRIRIREGEEDIYLVVKEKYDTKSGEYGGVFQILGEKKYPSTISVSRGKVIIYQLKKSIYY